MRFVKLLSLCCWLVFKRFTFSLGTNGLDAKFHRREVGKYWETEQHNDYFGLCKGFVDNKKMTKERQFDPLKLRTYHPFNPEVDEGAESKDDPEDRTNNQSEPEDSGLRIWRLLLPSALKKKKDILTVRTAANTTTPADSKQVQFIELIQYKSSVSCEVKDRTITVTATWNKLRSILPSSPQTPSDCVHRHPPGSTTLDQPSISPWCSVNTRYI